MALTGFPCEKRAEYIAASANLARWRLCGFCLSKLSTKKDDVIWNQYDDMSHESAWTSAWTKPFISIYCGKRQAHFKPAPWGAENHLPNGDTVIPFRPWQLRPKSQHLRTEPPCFRGIPSIFLWLNKPLIGIAIGRYKGISHGFAEPVFRHMQVYEGQKQRTR